MNPLDSHIQLGLRDTAYPWDLAAMAKAIEDGARDSILVQSWRPTCQSGEPSREDYMRLAYCALVQLEKEHRALNRAIGLMPGPLRFDPVEPPPPKPAP